MSKSEKVGKVIEKIRSEKEKIWFDTPSDFTALLKKRGSKNMRWPMIQWVESDSREVEMLLWFLWNSVKDEKTNVESLNVVTSNALSMYSQRFDGWYDMQNTAQALAEANEVLDSITTKSEYTELIEELLHFMGKLSFHLDNLIPWNEISGLYEWLNEEK